MKKNKFKNGFTLIELMVVILIIAILGAIGIVSFTSANASARDAKRVSDMESIKQAMLLRRQEVGSYPSVASFGTPTTNGWSGTSHLRVTLVGDGYLTAPGPQDPTGNYRAGSNTTSFCVCADVENNRGNSDGWNCTSWNPNRTGTHYCVSNQ